MKKIIYTASFFLPLLLILLLYAGSCGLLNTEGSSGEQKVIPDGVAVEIEITEGMTLTQIAQVLEEKGVIDSAFLFRLFVEQKGKEGNLIPGSYEMITGSSYEDTLNEITQGPAVVTYKLAIPEGFTVKEILEKAGSEIPFIEYRELENAAVINEYDYNYLGEASSLEGFLFPKTYELVIDYTARNVIEMMLAQYQFETGTLDYSIQEERGFSGYDILKIASMIEREAYIPEERELISAVIHNRLEIGYTLGIDATLTYFLDKWDEELTKSDLETDTPYNTRLYTGLPPTPICNPGLASIIAALNPADVDYLYFVITDSEKHSHSFATTQEEHDANRINAK